MIPLAEVTLEPEGDTVIAHVHGEVDLSNVDDIRSVLIEAVSHESECLVLDLTDTTYLDSTGVRLLFELAERLQGRRQELRLVVHEDAMVHRVIVLTQLHQRVPLDATVDAAISALRGAS
jgi:anti-anti-sigma factor